MCRFSALLYGEGRKDKKFLKSISELQKFCWHTKEWKFRFGNASGESPKTILEKCGKKTFGVDYDLVICFIDLDVLKREFPKKWEKKKVELEEMFPNIHIFWHRDNLEDELEKVLGEKIGKKEINNLAQKHTEKFINSAYWNKLLRIIKEREKELEKIKIS